uniref:Putative homing endonuclease n=1 Tax=viral metagenome TaxID=1070528 RepID=A0A6M3L6N9_9ZZZZ
MYQDSRWKKLRKIFLYNNPFCVECTKQGKDIQSTEVDHIQPHNGDYETFFDINNLQGLCKSCHSSKTIKEVVHNKQNVY